MRFLSPALFALAGRRARCRRCRPDERFAVNLGAAAGATVLDPQGIGTVSDSGETFLLTIGDRSAGTVGDTSAVGPIIKGGPGRTLPEVRRRDGEMR